MSNKIKINIPTGANEIIHTLQDNGYSAYIVGGCVRDSIIGREIHDWDICTSATPNDMLSVFKDRRIIETGLKHGTLTIKMEDDFYEVTTYRIDGNYSDNRRPDNVTFTDDLIKDLSRRDFRINAMAYNDYVGLIDPFNGMDDIKNKIIRCVGSAEKRFSEDALRILRALRFATQLGFDIDNNGIITDDNTEVQMRYHMHKLKNVSYERINSELCKILLSDNLLYYGKRYAYIFMFIIPELCTCYDFNQNNEWHVYDVYTHSLLAVNNCKTKDLVTRLTLLLHDIGKPFSYQDEELNTGSIFKIRHFKGHAKVSSEMADRILRKYKFDNSTREKVVELIQYHDAEINYNKSAIKRWLNRIGKEQLVRLIDIKICDSKAQNLTKTYNRIHDLEKLYNLIDEVLLEESCFKLKDLAINGNDLKEIGIKEGKNIGSILNILLNEVIDDNISNDKDELLKHAMYLNGLLNIKERK